MIKQSLSEIAEMIGAKLPSNFKDCEIEGISIDSRSINEKNLFIPIKGEKFDAFDFLSDIKEKNIAYLVDNEHENLITNTNCIIVEDTKKALFNLATSYLLKINPKVIAITGSNGKTTTKDMLKAVFSQKYKTHATAGNKNNEIGLPLTILDADLDCEFMILEMGTDKFGDISLLSSIAKSDLCVITNIGDSHLFHLKSKEGVCLAKLEILESLKEDGLFLYNGDDETLNRFINPSKITQKTLSYGQSPDNDFIIKDIRLTHQKTTFKIGHHKYHVNLAGIHQAYNAGLAVIIATHFDISPSKIQDGFDGVKLTGNRNQIQYYEHFTILNDSYKSNPQSLKSALDVFSLMEGYDQKIAILGDMLELGEQERKLHFDLGLYIDKDSVDYVLLKGELTKDMYEGLLMNFSEDQIFHFDSDEEIISCLENILKDNALILVKASRALKMENVITLIEENLQ